jgi:hypothetical protein
VQLAAQLWLAWAQVGTTVAFFLAWAVGSVPLPAWSRVPLAGAFGIAAVSAGFGAYRRLPAGVAKLIRWPSVPLREPRGLATLRLFHVLTIFFAVAQVAAGYLALADARAGWDPLRFFALVGTLRAVIFVVRSRSAR